MTLVPAPLLVPVVAPLVAVASLKFTRAYQAALAQGRDLLEENDAYYED